MPPLKTSPFAKNVFVVNHKRRHRFVPTAKAGCTTIKYITALDDNLFEFREGDKIQSVHDKLGYAPNGTSVIPIDSDAYGDFVAVAVWRDPVMRFMSWYQDKVLHPGQQYIFMSGLALDNTIDRCLEFLAFELSKSDPEWIDEHVRPHHGFYRPEQIDILVDMGDLSAYLSSIGVEAVEPTNRARQVSGGPTETQVQRIKQLYRRDYELYDAMTDKLWKP